MSAFTNFLNDLTNKNNLQYPDFKNQIKWVSYSNALEKEEERNKIISKLEHKLNRSFKNTKLWINNLSKGCQLCGEGEWSCLFITGKCNANCFYCPANQQTDGIPSTQLTSFNNVDDYIQYLDFFGFKGASLSGGEPLLFFERTLDYVQNIKKYFGDKIYLWIYTNGILGSEEIYRKLANAGIDEVRFDIGATKYDLKYLKKATNIIPTITIEIPAVPEEFDKLKRIIPELISIGVSNLNLHQLRLTNYNAPKLLKRNYTYLHGEQATVLESELTALKIIEYVADTNLNIGVNYCAFNFKNRFQKAGFRKKIASKFVEPHEQITENGFLRTITADNSFLYISGNKLLPEQSSTIKKPLSYEFQYRGLILDDHQENLLYLKKIILGNKAYFLRKSLAQHSEELDQNQIIQFIQLFENAGSQIPENAKLFSLWKKEFIEWDLRAYF
jgi:hypothetical protein